MKLTNILGKDLEDLGLFLEEERGIAYLKHGVRTLTWFYPSVTPLIVIRRIARRWARKYAKEKISG